MSEWNGAELRSSWFLLEGPVHRVSVPMKRAHEDDSHRFLPSGSPCASLDHDDESSSCDDVSIDNDSSSSSSGSSFSSSSSSSSSSGSGSHDAVANDSRLLVLTRAVQRLADAADEVRDANEEQRKQAMLTKNPGAFPWHKYTNYDRLLQRVEGVIEDLWKFRTVAETPSRTAFTMLLFDRNLRQTCAAIGECVAEAGRLKSHPRFRQWSAAAVLLNFVHTKTIPEPDASNLPAACKTCIYKFYDEMHAFVDQAYTLFLYYDTAAKT